MLTVPAALFVLSDEAGDRMFERTDAISNFVLRGGRERGRRQVSQPGNMLEAS